MRAQEASPTVNYDHIFDQAIERLHSEGRYRVFIDILRNGASTPTRGASLGHNGPKDITVWCSTIASPWASTPR